MVYISLYCFDYWHPSLLPHPPTHSTLPSPLPPPPPPSLPHPQNYDTSHSKS